MSGPFGSDPFGSDRSRKKRRTRINKMRWSEISGVDRPANETPGFMLMKAAGGRSDGELMRTARRRRAEARR
jgi:hypothetical protein